MDQPSQRALPVLLGLGSVWGASFLFIKVVVEDTGPMELVFGRLFFGVIAIGAYLVATKHRIKFEPRLLAQVSVVALLGNIIPFGLIAWGEEHISSGTASILNAMVPIFTAVIAATALEEEVMTPGRIAGLFLGFVGVGVLTGDDVLDITSSSVLGQLAVVLAAVCYGATAVINRQLLRGREPVTLAAIQVFLAMVYTAPLMLLVTKGSPDFNVGLDAMGSVVALGLLGTGLAYIAFLWLIENIGSVRASLVTYIVPVIAVVLGWVVLDEHIGVNTVAGGLLIVAGVASVMRGAAPVRESAVVVAAPAAGGE